MKLGLGKQWKNGGYSIAEWIYYVREQTVWWRRLRDIGKWFYLL
jgi:hypothetical protein